jgi:hypothetical protein
MLQKLQYNTVEQGTLGVLKSLFRLPELRDCRLVGGTALALQLGHRTSIDLDLFGRIDFNEILSLNLLANAGNALINRSSRSILTASINDVKVDLVNYNYPWLDKPLEVDGIRLATYKDIGAMKLAAITGRGTKKDFIDLYFLLHQFSLNELFDFYQQKYVDGSIFLVVKSMVYFNDADIEKSPKMFTRIPWNTIKKEIKTSLDRYLKDKGQAI